MRVTCIGGNQNHRGGHIAKAMLEGFKRHGVDAVYETQHVPSADLVVAYGWRNQTAFRHCLTRGGHYLYIDLGFWNRRPKHDRWNGHHKVCLDDWSPTRKMRRGCPDDRFKALRIEVKPWHSGESIVIAGMSHKSALGHCLRAEQWERRAIEDVRAVTQRPIVYRPKPSWRQARPIEGTIYANGATDLSEILASAHMVVTHHSNVAVDALAAGTPVHCQIGAASLLSSPINLAETPRIPSDQERAALLADLAYCQWTPDEMRSGACWDHFRGLL